MLGSIQPGSGIAGLSYTLFIIQVLHTALLFSALVLLKKAYTSHWRGRAGEHTIPVSVSVFSSTLALVILTIGFGFWNRVVQSSLPHLDTSTVVKLDLVWQITRIFGLTTLFLLVWQLHAICRGVTDFKMKSWKLERETGAVTILAGIVLTSFGL
jgi:hypothetical protein